MREEALLSKIGEALPILSDLCRADLLLFRRTGRDEAVVVAQARPHSFTPLWEEDCVGMTVTAEERPAVLAGLNGHIRHKTMHTTTVHGTTAAREVYPARGTSGETIAVLAKDSFWLAYERHRRRSKVFQQVLDQLISMVLRGELEGAKDLSPFGENDGILYVSNDRRIQYMSGIASAMYRQLGYRDSLVGRRLGDIESVDQDLVVKAWADVRCIERQDEHASLTWTRKAIPLISEDGGWWPLRRRTAPSKPLQRRLLGCFILLHDDTEALRQEAELQSRTAMLREMHHRVKNNLQIIASLMRMQARRVQGEEARRVLEESVQRITSVAVVHEFLSHSASQETISLQEVARRIIGQIRDSLLDPSRHIELRMSTGETIWLPAESATRCALVINELVQNAIEHGMADREEGQVTIELQDDGNIVTIVVTDNGVGLPEGFDLQTNANLGLQIVKSMVERDLRGSFALTTENGMTRATVRFVKLL